MKPTRLEGRFGALVSRSGCNKTSSLLRPGVSTRAFHQIESGKPTSRLDTLAPVLAVLGLQLQVENRAELLAARDDR